ncbi:nuclear transport factor 2 family protein [Parapedobacter tibetensis]|uniref:nuclear transport factor 2 family protein n=1 Tax=Parapedobacter tibetensis TaxID=2972951 RepID=UPI00214D7D3E|nr:nuclear transport factor 2 family protein [Parapedobacter tibetensis]
MIHIVRCGIVVCLLTFSIQTFAQVLGKVGSLLSADRSAARLSANEGPHTALLSVVDRSSTFFTPSPVNALEYLNNRPNIPDVLTWKPAFAAVAKSMEFGVTAGSLSFQRVGAIKRYGEYLTVWRRDRKGNWKIDLRAQIEHHGGKEEPELQYIEPDDKDYTRFRTKERIQQRKEIVTSNDQLLSAVLKSNAAVAYEEFLADDARLYFPWNIPIIGKSNILKFVKKQDLAIQAESLVASRSASGELAYSYGTATVATGSDHLKCNYVRIWQLQPDFQWRVIIEMLFEQ